MTIEAGEAVKTEHVDLMTVIPHKSTQLFVTNGSCCYYVKSHKQKFNSKLGSWVALSLSGLYDGGV